MEIRYNIIMNKKKPIPGVEWDITGVCNYSCEYCNPKKGGHCPDEKIEKVLMFFKTVKGLLNLVIIYV